MSVLVPQLEHVFGFDDVYASDGHVPWVKVTVVGLASERCQHLVHESFHRYLLHDFIQAHRIEGVKRSPLVVNFDDVFPVLDDVGGATRFDIADVEEERVVLVDLHSLEREMFFISDVRVAVHELGHDHLVPVLLVVLFHLLRYHIFLIEIKRLTFMVFVPNASLAHKAFVSSRLYKIWLKLVQLLESFGQVSHSYRLPSSELTLDVWATVQEIWLQVTLYLGPLCSNLLLIVFYRRLILNVIQFAKSWVPEEHCEHRLVAVSALILRVRLDLPLT